MADRKGLRLIGCVYGALTALVMLIAVLVVTAQVNGPAAARAEITGSIAAPR